MHIQIDAIHGFINSEAVITSKVISSDSLVGSLSTPITKYNSDYTATPSTTEQILKTEDRYMKEDIIIKPIPFYKVDNVKNGQTVCIGDESYGH